MYSSEYKLETQDVSLIKVPSALSSVYSISKNNVSDRPYLSVIIPLLNEEENIFDLIILIFVFVFVLFRLDDKLNPTPCKAHSL